MRNATATNVRCPACGSGQVMALSMVVAESDLRFTCCVTCEHRWWEQGGHSIPLRSVLGLVAAR